MLTVTRTLTTDDPQDVVAAIRQELSDRLLAAMNEQATSSAGRRLQLQGIVSELESVIRFLDTIKIERNKS